ncbi:MAG TPA: hypothetical protein VJI15_02355 [Candidatus Nanoarchaeia archaeon]|nr:hypothetical protein [Candidatus Nanoarchaeia archaeon]
MAAMKIMTKRKHRRIKYPKLLFLLFTFIVAYVLLIGSNVSVVHDLLSALGYLGTFLAGIFFAYGFTAAPATALLLILGKEQHIFLAASLAGFGALLGDLIIFRYIRYTSADEIKKLSQEKAIQAMQRWNNHLPTVFKKYLLTVFAGFIIASPLPDEIGVSLLAASRTISTKYFSVISYLLNTLGILVVLWIGRSI